MPYTVLMNFIIINMHVYIYITDCIKFTAYKLNIVYNEKEDHSKCSKISVVVLYFNTHAGIKKNYFIILHLVVNISWRNIIYGQLILSWQ